MVLDSSFSSLTQVGFAAPMRFAVLHDLEMVADRALCCLEFCKEISLSQDVLA